MIKWFAEHPTAANIVMISIVILGLMALPDLQRETFPRIKNDKVQINTLYPGATAEEIEDAICRRIEDAVEDITDLDEIHCESRESQGKAIAYMNEGAIMTRFLDDVKSAIDTIDDFPDQVEKPVIEELGRTDGVVSVAITGPEDPVVLKAYAEDVKQRLLTQARISTVAINGFSEHQIRIEIPAARLQQYGLSFADIANTIRSQSISSPLGTLESDSENLLLRFDDQRTSVYQFHDLVVLSGESGASITLGQIAKITDLFKQEENKILFNGKRAAVLEIKKTNLQDTLTALNDVKLFVETENRLAPRGIQLSLTQDFASSVQDRLDMLISNGMQGLLMVFLMLWLFFSFRYSFWVTMGLPVSFLGSFYLLPKFGITINMISMVGLLIGIGLLMDDAIVIAENIAVRIKKGDQAMQAAIKGVQQVVPGILSSFATTLLVFGSLAFISGEIGQILRVMPIVLIIVISVSLIEAFFVLPNHLGHSLAHMEKQPETKFRLWFDSAFDRFRDKTFGPLLDKAIDHRYLTTGIVVMLMMFAVALPVGGLLKFVGFPTTEGDILEARLLLPQGTPLAATEKLIAQITAGLDKVNQQFSKSEPDSQPLVQNITVMFGQNPDANETGPHVARIIADVLSTEVRNTSLAQLRQAWREEVGDLAGVITLKFSEPTVGPGGKAIDIRLSGTSLASLTAASAELQHWLRSYSGVIDVSDDLRPGKRELQLHLKPSAGILGLNAKTVSDQVRAAFNGQTLDEFPLGSETYNVDLRLASEDRYAVDDLETFTISTPEGNLIPLLTVAEINESRGWARINRINRQNTITITGDVQTKIANAQEILTLAAAEIFPRLQQTYGGLKIVLEGASNSSKETGQSIIKNVLLGLVGVYLLLALQFRGYLAPITVMIVIPTSFIGVAFGHYALGLDLTMPSIIGAASLFGVVVNDSILLVVFMREEREKGIEIMQAAKHAGRTRFRPILITSVTTIAGLTPLLAETSPQAQILIPMAASLAFGLVSATITALFLVPAIYCILSDFNALGKLHDET